MIKNNLNTSSKIGEIQNAVRNQKSAKAWKIVNEVSGRKNSCRSKIKAKNNEERVKLWQKHFQDLLGKPTKINENEEEISQIVNSELDIKKGRSLHSHATGRSERIMERPSYQ